MEFANRLFKGDRAVWVIIMILCFFSMVVGFSATSTLTYKTGVDYWQPILRHAAFLVGGIFLILVLHNIPSRYFSLGVILLVFTWILLLATLIFGQSKNEASRWIGMLGVQFQPSELAKPALLIYIAFIMSRKTMFTEKQRFWWTIIPVAITCLLILPENFSTAAILFLVCFLMMFVGKISTPYMLKLTGMILFIGIVWISSLFIVKEDYLKTLPRAMTWKSRIEDFVERKDAVIDPKTYKITDENRQVTYAKIAIANGGTGILGKLPGYGTQRDFLSLAYADFVFAIIVEEWGFLAGMVVLLLYVMLMFRVGVIAGRCKNMFQKLMVIGCGTMIAVQAFVNIAVAVSLFPVTGQTLPLISRGGTSILISCVLFGIILSISRFGAGFGNEEDPEPGEDEEGEAEPVLTDELLPELITIDTFEEA